MSARLALSRSGGLLPAASLPATPLSALFDRFLRERCYLQNVTPKTAAWYENAFLAFRRTVTIATPDELSRPVLNGFFVALRGRGLAAVSCNTYVKAINAFLAWLHAEGETPERLGADYRRGARGEVLSPDVSRLEADRVRNPGLL